VPLSEHEQRMLDQIEQALYAEDPKFANSVRQTNPVVHYKRRIVKAGLGFVVGMILLLTGLLLGELALQVAVSVFGFVLMLVSFLYGASAWRRAAGGSDTAVPVEEPRGRQKRKGGGNRPGMMDRFEARWRRRQEGNE